MSSILLALHVTGQATALLGRLGRELGSHVRGVAAKWLNNKTLAQLGIDVYRVRAQAARSFQRLLPAILP
jgi:hypothetical protein